MSIWSLFTSVVQRLVYNGEAALVTLVDKLCTFSLNTATEMLHMQVIAVVKGIIVTQHVDKLIQACLNSHQSLSVNW
jgi:hypothetical protein